MVYMEENDNHKKQKNNKYVHDLAFGYHRYVVVVSKEK